MLEESKHQMASKDVEIIALQEQLNSAKGNVDELKSTVTCLNEKITQCHRDKQLECEKLSQQLLATGTECLRLNLVEVLVNGVCLSTLEHCELSLQHIFALKYVFFLFRNSIECSV